MKPACDNKGRIIFNRRMRGRDGTVYGIASTGAWHRIPPKVRLTKKTRLRQRRAQKQFEAAMQEEAA